jgi:hypothetical protein
MAYGLMVHARAERELAAAQNGKLPWRLAGCEEEDQEEQEEKEDEGTEQSRNGPE